MNNFLKCILLLGLTSSCLSKEDLSSLKRNKIIFEQKMEIKPSSVNCFIHVDIYECSGITNAGFPIMYSCTTTICTMDK